MPSYTDIEVKNLFQFGTIELESRLVLGHTSVGYQTIDSTCLLYHLVDSFLHTFLRGHVGLNIVEIGESLLQSRKIFTWVHQVQGVYDLGRVGQAHLGNSQTNSPGWRR